MELERRGVRGSDAPRFELQSGKTGRMRGGYRLECADILRANNAASKTECCLRVLELGREYRKPSQEPPRVYSCFGLTRAMEAALGWTRWELSYVMRAMRADLAVWSTHMSMANVMSPPVAKKSPHPWGCDFSALAGGHPLS